MKIKTCSTIASALLLSTTLALSSPSGGVVKSGSANIVHVDKTTNINQSSNSASINWNTFNIAKDESVNFNQPSSSSITLNRVIGTEKSIISGALNANGQVWILNSNGVLFGKTASINTSGLLATTKEISTDSFKSKDYTLQGNSINSVINDGSINIKSNGYVILAANEVQNSGVIKAIRGRVHLVGANSISINLNGNSLISLTVNKGVLDSLVKNSGDIYADGGEIYLSTNAKNELLKGVVNNTGLIEANSIDDLEGKTYNGKIELFAHGGTAEVGGVINAKDGFVETSGREFSILSDADINAGEWLIDPYGVNIDRVLAGNIVTALNGGTDVTINASSSGVSGTGVSGVSEDSSVTEGDIDVNSAIIWDSANTLTLDASNNINVKATIEDKDTAGGGVLFKVIMGGTSTDDVLFPKSGTTYPGKVVINSLNQLKTLDDLMDNDKGLAGNYELGSDIVATTTSSWNSGKGWKPLGTAGSINFNFKGTFDGKDHTISDLFINRPKQQHTGFFGSTNGATIKNVKLTNVNITGVEYTGGLVGTNLDSTITNSYVAGTVTGTSNVGGLAGRNIESSTITNSYANVTVIATGISAQVGGLVGTNDDSIITNSHATGTVTGSGSSVGGLVGGNFSRSTITGSYATGNVKGSGSSVGGLVGINANSTITGTSYATGDVSGTTGSGSDTGGLIGSNENSTISGTFYATGNVKGSGSDTGGLIGSNKSSTISGTTFYATGDVKGTTNVGGLIGYNKSSNLTGSTDNYKNGTVKGTTNVGGLIGKNENSTIKSFTLGNTVTVTGSTVEIATSSDSTNIGGLIGKNIGSKITSLVSAGAVSGNSSVGGLIGDNGSGSDILSSSSSSTVTGTGTDKDDKKIFSSIGGLVGYNLSNITNSSASGVVTGTNSIGGLVGYSGGGIITTGSHTSGTITGATNVGGLVGYGGSEIINSNTSGITKGTSSEIGGLVGYNTKNITNSHTTGKVDGYGNTGGLVGTNNYSAIITDSSATGDVSGAGSVGGLVGQNISKATITSTSTGTSYATGDVTGTTSVGGLIGYNTSSDLTGSADIYYKNGTVTGVANVGGLIGKNESSKITSFTVGKDAKVNGTTDSVDSNIGGLIGLNTGSTSEIASSSSQATVNGGTNSTSVGGLIGKNDGSTISGTSYATGDVTGKTDVGGLVGYNTSSDLTGSADIYYKSGTVTGVANVGGLIGENEKSTITSFVLDNTVKVTGTSGKTNKNIGGLVGYNYDNSTIKKSLSKVSVTGKTTSSNVGGLVGSNEKSSRIENSYTTGAITGGTKVGGLVGFNTDTSTILNSYEIGKVRGTSDIGGLVGLNDSSTSTITSSYYNSNVNPTSSSYGEPRTQNQLKDIKTFSSNGWDIAINNSSKPDYLYPFFPESGSTIWEIHPLRDATTDLDNIITPIINDNLIRVENPEIRIPGKGVHAPIISMPLDGELNQIITLKEIRVDRDNTKEDIRVPVRKSSMIELVNGGVNLPSGVDQVFYALGKHRSDF